MVDMAPESTRLPTDDENVLAALAHPLRRRLLDAFAATGPATVSMLAEQLDQRIGNISHHIRVLAKAGLVVEDTARAKDRREHWWRTTGGPISFTSVPEARSPSAAAAAVAAERVNVEQHVSKVTTWMRDRASQPDWAAAAFSTDAWVTASTDELAALGAEINDVIARWARRRAPADGAERRTVFVFAHGVPAQP